MVSRRFFLLRPGNGDKEETSTGRQIVRCGEATGGIFRNWWTLGLIRNFKNCTRNCYIVNHFLKAIVQKTTFLLVKRRFCLVLWYRAFFRSSDCDDDHLPGLMERMSVRILLRHKYYLLHKISITSKFIKSGIGLLAVTKKKSVDKRKQATSQKNSIKFN